MNILFSSESVQLLCSCDVNQKCKIFHWFPNHVFYIGHGNTRFSYVYTIEMRKSPLWKTSRWNARLIYTINKNNKKKNNNQNQVRITKAFEKFTLSEKNLSIIWLKYFFCTHWTIFLPLTFSNFVDSNNSSILWSLRLMLPKAFASAFYCFQTCEKIARQFKILAILYFYRFFIIFNLHYMQQLLLVIELN